MLTVSLGEAPNARVFLVDRDMHRIVVLTMNGRRIGGRDTRDVPIAPLDEPCDLAFAPHRSIDMAPLQPIAGAPVRCQYAPVASRGRAGGKPGEFTMPQSVAVQPDDRFAGADRENNGVQLLTTDGTWLAC
jgi:peptidylglycine monooxygenase